MGNDMVAADSSSLVRRLWQYCNVLRDDGLSYPDYVEQLTYLLFLKMSSEQKDGPVPRGYEWSSFADLDASAMHRRYADILAALGKSDGMLGLIFRNARNKIQDPAKLRLLVADLIGAMEWTGLSVDVKGDAYEGLLEKNARDTKSGAGQYFTPRPLIEAIVECMDPRPNEVVCDPACGTAGFLLATYEYIVKSNHGMSNHQMKHLQTKALRGVELVEEVARLAAMNLLLHGVGGREDDELPVRRADSLAEPPSEQVDVVLTNPPFGVKGSMTYTKDGKSRRAADDLSVMRPDFWVRTANKQLNFVQHVVGLLKPGGRAAVVLPDNVLYEDGAAAVIRRHLLETCDVHTLLRLPTGLFYAPGIKANVLFFERTSSDRSMRSDLLVYDLRSENRFSLKAKPLRRSDLDEFVALYRSRGNMRDMKENPRWRVFKRTELVASRDCRLYFTWPGSESDSGPAMSRLDAISQQITADLQNALDRILAAGGGE
jgi:type I restriction enzyme M protein